MEEMKNLVIQTLETKGVLGQIRAKLRSSVFKIVDEQDQRNNPPMGCGLKWENPLLYKIRDTNIGGLISELVREFMEHLKMDYSLSVFIPECSISPERLKRDEILARLGLNSNSLAADLPVIYFIIYYFIESLQSNPQAVHNTLNNFTGDLEKSSDEIIMRNLYNYQASNMGETEENQKINVMEERKTTEPVEEVKQNPIPKKSEFEKIEDFETGKRRSYEYEDRRSGPDSRNSAINNENSGNKYKDNDIEGIKSHIILLDQEIEPQLPNSNLSNYNSIVPPQQNTKDPPLQQSNSDGVHHKISQESIHTENDDIIEEIMIEDDFDDFDQSEKKVAGSNNFTISQSGGYDGTVDSNALERYNYIEPVEK